MAAGRGLHVHSRPRLQTRTDTGHGEINSEQAGMELNCPNAICVSLAVYKGGNLR